MRHDEAGLLEFRDPHLPLTPLKQARLYDMVFLKRRSPLANASGATGKASQNGTGGKMVSVITSQALSRRRIEMDSQYWLCFCFSSKPPQKESPQISTHPGTRMRITSHPGLSQCGCMQIVFGHISRCSSVSLVLSVPALACVGFQALHLEGFVHSSNLFRCQFEVRWAPLQHVERLADGKHQT